VAARILLLLALIAGLAIGAGPMPRRSDASVPCTCCPMPAGVSCCSVDDAPPSDAPLAPPSFAPLKQMLAPVLPLLAILSSSDVELPQTPRRSEPHRTAPARLALLCTRLI
jgi:hypothetical protein